MKALIGKSSPANQTRTAEIALKGFFALVKQWDVSTGQAMTLLGLTSRSTYNSWKKSAPAKLPHDTLERISYLLGIHKALRIIFSRDHGSVVDWVNKPNSNYLFGGRSALDRMLSGNVSDLFLVRNFLDSQRGGWG